MISKIKRCKQCGKEFTAYRTTDKLCSNKCFNILEKEKKAIKKEKKKNNIRAIYKSNVEMAKTIAKTRDGYVCQRCGKTKPQFIIDGSHVINEASDHRLSTNEANIKALCRSCHLYWWHKNPIEAYEWFSEKFPGRFEEIKQIQKENMKLGPITKEWHMQEHERLLKKMKEI